LSDSAGILRYSRSGADGAISEFSGDPASLGTYDLVRATTLDHVVGDRRVDMMKIDVEGAEGLVLQGAHETLRRCRPLIIFEFSPPSLEVTSRRSGREVLDDLSQLGYSFDLADASREFVARTTEEALQMFHNADGDHVNLVAWQSRSG
jgi:hypothetical protein